MGILFTGQKDEICPFEAFLLTHFWPDYTEEVDVLSAGDVVFLFQALESFHNMKLIKVEARSVPHGAPPACRPPPLNPGQTTLHTSSDLCSKVSVSHQAVPDSPPICSPTLPPHSIPLQPWLLQSPESPEHDFQLCIYLSGDALVSLPSKYKTSFDNVFYCVLMAQHWQKVHA